MPVERPGAAARAALWTIVAGGLAVRLIGLGYGLPAVYNPDEVAIMNRALAFATGDLNPHNFLYPTLYFYALFAWEGLAFGVLRLAGAVESLAAFQREFFVDPSRIFLAGRLLTALAGAATVWLVARLGTRLAGRTAGLLAALFFAVSPLAVRDAHYVKHDVPVTLLIVAAHLVLARLLDPAVRAAGPRPWLAAGALAGLAMSTHYYAVFLAVPLALVALLPAAPGEPWARRARGLGLMAAAAAAAFAATSPFLFVEPATAWRDIVANREIVVDRAVGAGGFAASLGRYVTLVAADGLGWPVFAAALAGLAAMARAGRRGLLVWAFPAPFLLFIANTVPASRYLNPVVPFLAVAAAAVLARIAARAGRVRAAVLVTAIALAVPAATASVRTGLFFRRPDTRTLARAYIEREIPAGASILVQPYSVPLTPSREALVEALRLTLGSEDRASIKFRLQLDLDPYPAPAYRTIYLGAGGLDVDRRYVDPAAFAEAGSLAPLRALGVAYVVLKRYNGPDPSLESLLSALDREGRLIAGFSPYRSGVPAGERHTVAPFLHNTDRRIEAVLDRPGPAIEIWRIH